MSRHWLGLLVLAVWIGAGRVAHATITPSPGSLDFGNVVVGTTPSPTRDDTLTSDTSVMHVTVAVHSAPGCNDFSIMSPTTEFNLNPGAGGSQVVTVQFAPSAPADRNCVVDINVNGMFVRSFNITGTGQAPAIHVDQFPTFPDAEVGKSSTAQLKLTNSGASALHIANATLSPGSVFSVSGVPTTPLAVGAHATLDLTCTPPGTLGDFADTLVIASDASNENRLNISLACKGTQGVLALDQTMALDFGTVPRGATQTRTFKVSNTGNVDVTSVTLAVTANLGYSLDTTSIATLPPGPANAVTVTVSFKPMSKTDGGTAMITVSGRWGTTPTLIELPPLDVTGTEASFGLDPVQPMIDFGKFRYDTHPRKTFQLLNDGKATLRMTAPFLPDGGTKAGEYQVVLARGNVPVGATATLAENDQVTVEVTPQIQHRIGVVSGRIDITPDVGTPLHVPVTGMATAAEIDAPATVDFGVVDLSGPPVTQTILITNTGDGALDVRSLTATDPSSGGAPSAAFHFALPGTLPQLERGASLAIPVTYQPTVATGATPDAVLLTVQLGGSLDADLTIMVTGGAVFSEIHGGGGCNAGTGRAGGLVIALAALIALRRRRRLAIVAAASLAAPPVVRADGIGLTVFAPTPATTGESFALQLPDVGARGMWAANAVVSYASNPLLIDSVAGDGGRVTRALVGSSTLLQLGAAYALLDRLELGAHVPLYVQTGDAGSMRQAAHGAALGDLALHAKARLWRGDAGAGALVTGASAIVMLPTASKDQFTGSDQPEARVLLLGSFTPAVLGSRLALSVNAGAVLRGTSSYANIEQRSAIAWGAGASVRVVPRLWTTAELFGELTPSARRPEPVPGAMSSPVTMSQVEGLAGVRIEVEHRITVGLALGRGMTRAPGTPDLRGVLSLSIVPGAAPSEPPRPHVAPVQDVDTDGDGIPDARDKCPGEPEDRDGFQDADGCPDPDNDGDGIPDASDRCPNDPEDRDGFQDADGCPDPDNDGDGIPDASDRCPNEPETVNGFQDADGCPDSLPAADPAAATRAAEATFARGRELMAQSQYAAACTAFEQSQRLDPQFGTQFNLAICYEKLGKLATAWNLYRELARSDSNPPRRARAGKVAAALASRVAKLRLVLTNHPGGAQVLLNGVDAGALLGVEAPVDAGRYTVAATAAGYRPWQRTVEAEDGRVVTVVIDLHPLP